MAPVAASQLKRRMSLTENVTAAEQNRCFEFLSTAIQKAEKQGLGRAFSWVKLSSRENLGGFESEQSVNKRVKRSRTLSRTS